MKKKAISFLTAFLTAISCTATMLPTITGTAIAASTSNVKFDEDEFYVAVGTCKGATQLRYFAQKSDGSYTVEKVVWEDAPADISYGDVFIGDGNIEMTKVMAAPDNPVYAMAYYYQLDDGEKLNKVGKCDDFMEKKVLTVSSKTYDGSAHWSIRYKDSGGKEYYYGLSNFASTLTVDPLDCEVGDVYTYALCNDYMVIPLAKENDISDVYAEPEYKIVKLPDKVEYKLGEQIDLKGIEIEVTKDKKEPVVYTYPDVAFDYQSNIPKSPSVVLSTDFRNDKAGTYKVEVVGADNVSFDVKVVDYSAISDTTGTTTTTSTTTTETSTTFSTTTRSTGTMPVSTDAQGRILDQNGNVLIVNGTSAVVSQPVTTTTAAVTMVFNGTKKMTLDDVIALSKKGSALDWKDFEEYKGRDVGSGLYIWEFTLEDGYVLDVGGTIDKKPLYILLSHDDDKGIDIRTDDVEKYLSDSAKVSNIKGDANCDGQVDLSDAVMIMQALANPNKYGIDGTAEHHLTEQGKLNGDMNGDGLTVGDAQAIQRKLLGLDESDSNQNIDNSEYLFGNEPSGSVMKPQRLALNCNSFCANGETLKIQMLMGDKYTYNQEHNSYPNFDSEGNPEYSIFATENFKKIDDERLVVNGAKSEYTKTFTKEDMNSLDITGKEGDYTAYYTDTAEIDFSNYSSGSTGCISVSFGWKADGVNPYNPSSDFDGTSQTIYFYVGENGTGISNNGWEAAQKAYEDKSDNDIMFYDSLYLKWNGKEVMSNLYEELRKPNEEELAINFKLSSSPNGDFEYKGKTLEEYGKERLYQNYLKYEQLLIYGDYLKYGETLYTTGAPDGTKWVKEFYEETIDDIGEELLSKYIVEGEFLKDQLKADIAELKQNANNAYNEAEKAYFKYISDRAIKQLDEQNIRYEYMTEPKRLVIYVTAEEFKSLSLDNVSRYGLDISVTKGVTVNAIA